MAKISRSEIYRRNNPRTNPPPWSVTLCQGTSVCAPHLWGWRVCCSLHGIRMCRQGITVYELMEIQLITAKDVLECLTVEERLRMPRLVQTLRSAGDQPFDALDAESQGKDHNPMALAIGDVEHFPDVVHLLLVARARVHGNALLLRMLKSIQVSVAALNTRHEGRSAWLGGGGWAGGGGAKRRKNDPSPLVFVLKIMNLLVFSILSRKSILGSLPLGVCMSFTGESTERHCCTLVFDLSSAASIRPSQAPERNSEASKVCPLINSSNPPGRAL